MLYEILRLEDNNIVVKRCPGTKEKVIVDCAENKKDQYSGYKIFGKEIGLFYWDYSGAWLGQINPLPLYTYEGKSYLYFNAVEDLTGENPLNRFSWQEDEDVYGIGELENTPEKLHKIILEES